VAWLGILYPETCRGCDSPLGLQNDVLCDRCWLRLAWVNEARLLADVARDWCRSNGVRFRSDEWPPSVGRVRARAVAYLDPNLAAVIHHLKYRRRKKVARRLGSWMARVMLSDAEFRSCNGLVPMPLRPEKTRERGYNPVTLLAEVVAERTRVRILDDVLSKTRATRSQTELPPQERMRNPRNSFGLRNPERVSGKHLVLVDDVLTSGSTAAVAAGLLLESGAAEVRVLTAARTPVAP
jgi:ComF family protein